MITSETKYTVSNKDVFKNKANDLMLELIHKELASVDGNGAILTIDPYEKASNGEFVISVKTFDNGINTK